MQEKNYYKGIKEVSFQVLRIRFPRWMS